VEDYAARKGWSVRGGRALARAGAQLRCARACARGGGVALAARMKPSVVPKAHPTASAAECGAASGLNDNFCLVARTPPIHLHESARWQPEIGKPWALWRLC
jgi:hypothetical protein